MKTILLSIIALALAALALSWRVLFVKGGKFPDGHIGHSPEMRKRGIDCSHKQ